MSQPESMKRLRDLAELLTRMADENAIALQELPVNAGALDRITGRIAKALQKGESEFEKEAEKARLFLYVNAFDRMFLTREIVEEYFRRNRWKFPPGKGWSQAMKKKVCEELRRRRTIEEFRRDARALIAERYIDFVNLGDDELRNQMRACASVAEIKRRIPGGLAPKPAPKKIEAYIDQVLAGIQRARSQFAHEYQQ